MIDIHSHVVWGLDDGASSDLDSLDMLRIASEDGITDIVATPHSNAQYLFQPGLRNSPVAAKESPSFTQAAKSTSAATTLAPCSTAPPPTPSTPAPTCFSNSPASTSAGTPSPSCGSCWTPASCPSWLIRSATSPSSETSPG